MFEYILQQIRDSPDITTKETKTSRFNSLPSDNDRLCDPCSTITPAFFKQSNLPIKLYDKVSELRVSAEKGCPLCALLQTRLESFLGLHIEEEKLLEYMCDAEGPVRLIWLPKNRKWKDESSDGEVEDRNDEGQADIHLLVDELGLNVLRGSDNVTFPWKAIAVSGLPYRGEYLFELLYTEGYPYLCLVTLVSPKALNRPR